MEYERTGENDADVLLRPGLLAFVEPVATSRMPTCYLNLI